MMRSLKFKNLFFQPLTLCMLALTSQVVYSGQIYTIYNTGSQNGVSVRDSDTFSQSLFFNPGFSINGITAGDNNDMYLTSGNNIYNYSNTGTLLNSFTFPNSGINYQDVTFDGNNIYAAYTGSQNGVSIRDADTFGSSSFFNPGFAVSDISAGDNNNLYLTADNSIYNYASSGALIDSFVFPNNGINYKDITFAGDNIYTVYTGSQNGVTVRNSDTLSQSLFFFDPGFVISGIAAGDNNDMFLTSGNSIYNYSDTGALLGSFTFPGSGINYTDIAFAADIAKVPEPSVLALLGLGLMGIRLSKRKKLN